MADLVGTALQVIQYIIDAKFQVQCNKRQCVRLVERIEVVRSSLQRLQLQPIENVSIQSNLQRLVHFLQEVKYVLMKFQDKHYFMKVYDRNVDTETFIDLNQTLTELIHLLQFDMVVCNTFEQHQQDLLDREADQLELKTMLIGMKDEIRAITTVNQMEMMEKFEKMHQLQMQEIQRQRDLLLEQLNKPPQQQQQQPQQHVMLLDAKTIQLLVEQIKAVQSSLFVEDKIGAPSSNSATTSVTLPPLLKIDPAQVQCDRSARGSLLGVGGFGDVYRGTMAGATIAVKYLRDSSPATLKALKKEALILQLISSHPSIIRYYGAQLDVLPCYLVMEYAICSLYDLLYLEEKDESSQAAILQVITRRLMKEDEHSLGRKVQWLYETSCALQHLHSLHVTHRDIKPMNILISTDGKAKLTDFGLAKVKHLAVTQTSVGIQKGTATYIPPEILLAEDDDSIEYNEKTDVYSFGIVMNEVLDHAKPFPNLKMNQLLNKLIRDREMRPILFRCQEELDRQTSKGDGIMLELQTLIQRSWHCLQEERPSFQFITQCLCRIGKRFGTLIVQPPAVNVISLVVSAPMSPVRSAETVVARASDIPDMVTEDQMKALVRIPPAAPVVVSPAIAYLPIANVFELSQEVVLSNETSKQVLLNESCNGNQWAKAALMVLYATGCFVIPKQLSEAQSLGDELFVWLSSESSPSSTNARYAHHYLYFIFQYGLAKSKGGKDEAMAFWHLKHSADIGLATSRALVGYHYMHGDLANVEHNPVLAIRYLKQAIENYDFFAQCWYGICCEQGIGIKKDASNAVTYYRLSANKGFRDAQHLLGNAYERGYGCFIDIEEAKRWYTKAANQGYRPAMDALSRISKSGSSDNSLTQPHLPIQVGTLIAVSSTSDGIVSPTVSDALHYVAIPPVPMSFAVTNTIPTETTPSVMSLREFHRLHEQVRMNQRMALQVLEQHVNQGSIYAKAIIMTITLSNDSFILPENKARSTALSHEVMPWLQTTAKKVNVPVDTFEDEEVLFAKYMLGKCLLDGINISKDLYRGFGLIKQCVDRNYDYCCKGIYGNCYLEGFGVTKGSAYGFRIIKEAAESGDYQSKYKVGWCYEHGVGIPRDFKQARQYYLMAANGGWTESFSALGAIYEERKGVAKDLEEAMKWFQRGKEVNCPYSTRAVNRIEPMLLKQRQYRDMIKPNHKTCQECSALFTRIRLNEMDALELLQSEVRANNYWAMGNMAIVYFIGVHICMKNETLANELATKARPLFEYIVTESTNREEQGYAGLLLTRFYYEGISVSPNVSRCYLYASIANDANIPRGTGTFAFYLGEGIGCIKDIPRSLRLMKMAADSTENDFQSMHDYAWYCECGVGGTTSDMVTAFTYYKRAADIGFVDSQEKCGYCYEKGLGSPKNVTEARRYYELAAAQGSVSALKALNRLGDRGSSNVTSSSSSKSGFFRMIFG